ncbi:MAG: hypothetical protein C5B49_05095 [Bdellovibrio sp.]|nr:MAG: hypothetical protein C5B49_05095 [Bdellovibrio sp.]
MQEIKYFFLFAGGLVCGFHALMTLLLLLPPNPFSQQFKGVTGAYVKSFFAQDWRLFAPEPPTKNFYLWHRCRTQEGWSGWQDMGEQLRRQMTGNPFSYRPKLYLFYGSMAGNLTLAPDKRNPRLVRLADKFVSVACVSQFGPSVLAAQIRSVWRPIPSYESRFQEAAPESTHVVEYPVFAVK